MTDICGSFARSAANLEDIELRIAVQSAVFQAVQVFTEEQGFASHYEPGKPLTEDEQHDQNAFDRQYAENMEIALHGVSFDDYVEEYSNNISLARDLRTDLTIADLECTAPVVSEINQLLQDTADDIDVIMDELGNGPSPM